MADLNSNPDHDRIADIVHEAQRTWQHNDRLAAALPSWNHPDRSQQDTVWLDYIAHINDQACMSLTFDRVPISQFRGALGNRLLLWPNGLEQRQRISVVSSRLSERKDRHRRWFDALRTVAVRCQPQQECLSVVEGTAACDAVSRAAVLFGVPLLKINVEAGQITRPEDLIEWCRSVILQPSPDDPHITPLWISPEFVAPEQTSRVSDSAAADAASVLAGDRVVALHCREGGTIQRLLLTSLQQAPKPTVLLADDADQTSPSTRLTLTEAGAVQWLLEGQQQTYSADGSASEAEVIAATFAEESPVVLRPEEWLCHWTRPRRGPWPDESVDDYWDALIMGCVSADHSALGTLLRIIETRQLLPSEMSHGAVSWTAVPLSEFSERRIYRRHLRRYDFEPWGVAVRRSVLERMGCRPVTYVKPGNNVAEESWQTHPESDASGKIDWTVEREWRIPKCVDLSTISPEHVFVFAATEAEAAALKANSPWPVICTPRG